MLQCYSLQCASEGKGYRSLYPLLRNRKISSVYSDKGSEIKASQLKSEVRSNGLSQGSTHKRYIFAILTLRDRPRAVILKYSKFI